MKECISCKNRFEGQFCNNCGEKLVTPQDFTLKHFFNNVLNAFTNLDNKFLRSMKLLCFRPGTLSKYFVEGRRVSYMKPFQLFLVANIIFFIILSDADIFRCPSKWYFIESFDGINVLAKLSKIMDAQSMTQEEVAIAYDSMSNNLAKSLLFLFLPLLGFITMLLHWKSRKPIGIHVVFAQHFFAFFLFVCITALPLMQMTDIGIHKLFVVLIFLYLIISLRTFYNQKWIHAIWKSILFFVGLIIAIGVYRNFISLLSLYVL